MSASSEPAESAAPPAPKPPFPVVGIGASAGGLEAFRTLVDHLPTDTGMAFVVVPHLDPTHPSMLAQLLAQHAPLPVAELTAPSTTIAPNQIYVLAPNTLLSVTSSGRLEVTAPPTDAARRACIDHFFGSLAAVLRERAVGVILSGSASDGTDGVRAIKASGGITFAQDDSASFIDMPRNAVASGCVDFVLPPEEIARELVRIAHHPFLSKPLPGERGSEAVEEPLQDTARILELIGGGTGVDFSQYKQTTVRRRIARRMALRHIERIPQYISYLEDHPAEVRALHDDILINVTSFFREPVVFQALQERVFPALVKGRSPHDPIRIWVPGCSTGEEVYSIAISLLEFFDSARTSFPVQIFGTGLSEPMVERARLGIFDGAIEAEVRPERLRRFFSKLTPSEYQVAKSVRELCVFARQDLSRDPPFSRLDLLSCRNVLIYLAAPLQRRVLPTFHYALKPNGFLLLGSSETVGPFGNLFSTFDAANKIYTKVPNATSSRFDVLVPGSLRGIRALPGQPKVELPGASPEFDPGKEADRLLLGSHVPAAVVVDEGGDIVHVRGETGLYLRPAPGKPALHLIKMVREDLLVDLERTIREAREKGYAVRRDDIPLRTAERWHRASLEVVPFRATDADPWYFLILFFETPERRPPSPEAAPAAVSASDRDAELGHLRQELVAARGYHQRVLEKYEAANEELRAAHEEVLSANEELQSTNEELETAKEELQSTNEELATLNDEAQQRNAELRRANSDLENVLANVNVPIAVVDSSLALRRITPPAERLFNVRPADAGRSISNFKHNFEGEDLEAIILGVLDTLEPAVREIQDRDGRWYMLRVHPYRSDDRRIDGAVIVLHDIHALKVSLLDTARARSFMASIVEAVPEAMLVLDQQFRILMANPAWYRSFRGRPDDTEHRVLFSLPGWELPALRTLLGGALASGTPFDAAEVEFQPHDGPARSLLVTGRQIVQQKVGVSLLLTVADITARKQAEVALRDSEARLSAIFNQVVAGIVLMNLDGRFVMVNERFCSLVSRPRARVLGETLDVFTAPDDRASSAAALEELRAKGHAGGRDIRLVRPDGTAVWVSVHPSFVAGPDEAPTHILLLVQDISERRQAEQSLRELTGALEHRVQERTAELEDAVRDLTQFSSTVSHDLRAPLRAMASFSHLLVEQYQGKILDGRGLDYVRRIEASATRMDALTESLLAYSRVGRMELPRSLVQVADVVADVASEIDLELIRTGATLSVEGPTYAVYGHRLLLGQVLGNLVRNAIKFVAPGVAARVRIRTERVGPNVRIWVEDNGIGIAPEYQDRVFGVFERLHNVEEYPGAGIGLAIVKRAAERMGGTVGVVSAKGEGSRFWVELPGQEPT